MKNLSLKIDILFRSFRVKVMVVLVASMLFAGTLSNFLVYRFALDAQFNQLRDKLKIIAQTAALMVDAETLKQIPLNRSGADTLQYKAVEEKLRQVKEVNPPIRFIYTMAKTEQEGILEFIVDPEPVVKSAKKKNLTSYPGDKYDARKFPELLSAFNGPNADKRLVTDKWGTALSGYAPIIDKEGKAVAILGVDIMAMDIYNTQRQVNRRAAVVLFIGVIFSVILGLFFSKRITEPVNRLGEGIRHITEGDLKYQVETKGEDELGRLTEYFNKMTMSLYESRRKIHNYFYRVIQSFVRIEEARDHYTRGHSDRVAEYSKKIALRMGFAKEEVELVKETAILHDIGKFGIQESILNKKGKLTDEEWEVVKKHPIIGEGILKPMKPLLLNPEMLDIVREHQERYDGKGYPDKLSGEKIDIFAQIISVADAYDAMTSSRAYREAFSKDAAIDELKKNSGTQFNPKIIDIFLEILKEDSKEI